MNDTQAMEAALEQARRAARADEVPVGAVLVSTADGRLLAAGANRTLTDTDPTAHAEIVALRAAAAALGAPRLPGTTLYVTLEPCLMCLGAMVHARVDRVVFAAADPKVGATRRFQEVPVDFCGLNHRLAIDGGLLAPSAAELLRAFFRRRRAHPEAGQRRGEALRQRRRP
ncbi:MAG: tRNA adenosine(34) deaminase TadA [Acidobacteriota bacterium]|nr:tRNA adenosine(34) deaminase TadA [Acidobacteriota bacterium]MDQ7087854.1 tRNA adenosine(34) deaminase TadA [Acidobacteriota bacterium]